GRKQRRLARRGLSLPCGLRASERPSCRGARRCFGGGRSVYCPAKPLSRLNVGNARVPCLSHARRIRIATYRRKSLMQDMLKSAAPSKRLDPGEEHFRIPSSVEGLRLF